MTTHVLHNKGSEEPHHRPAHTTHPRSQTRVLPTRIKHPKHSKPPRVLRLFPPPETDLVSNSLLSYLPNVLFKKKILKNHLKVYSVSFCQNTCPAFNSKTIFASESLAATLSTASYWEMLMFYGFIYMRWMNVKLSSCLASNYKTQK